jgi:type-F conjugative transfer system pilin assembly protein TrbC
MRSKMSFIKLMISSFIFLLSASVSLAQANMQSIINQGIRDSDAATKKILDNNNFRQEIKAASEKAKIFHDEAKLISVKRLADLKKQTDNFKSNVVQPIGTCAIFVSFSMPEPSLKQIIADADYYRVPVVIRGLYKNSLKETANKIFALTKENNKGGILINPGWFKKYAIKSVPAFLLTTSREDNSDGDLVYGNIPLKRALIIISEKGEYAKEALRILAGGSR